MRPRLNERIFMTKWCWIVLAIALMASAAHAQTDVWPEPVIKQNVFTIPLWLPKFTGDGDLISRAQRIEQIVLNDLEFTGLFNIQRDEPTAVGMKPNQTAVCVRGKMFRDANGVSFEGTVTDVASNSFMGGKKYRVTDSELRRVAHHFSDEVVRLVTGNQGVASTQLVYTRRIGDKWELTISDYDGYGPKTLIRQAVPLLCPRWMDGNQAVVYTSFRDGKADLFVRYISEARSRPLATFNGTNTAPDWSQRQGMLLAALSKDGNTEIYKLDKTGRVLTELTHNRAIDTSPCWAPSGREVVFLSDRSGSPQLYIMDNDGGNVRRITFTGGYNASPAWSPRGDLIVFSTRMGSEFQLATITPDGRDGILITKDATSYEDARWAADGRHLVCTARGKDETVSVVDIVTGGKRILAQGSDPDWSSP
jgi:TolB protein